MQFLVCGIVDTILFRCSLTYDSSLLQVVAAVGFKGERLDIPNTVNHEVAALIEACWAR